MGGTLGTGERQQRDTLPLHPDAPDASVEPGFSYSLVRRSRAPMTPMLIRARWRASLPLLARSACGPERDRAPARPADAVVESCPLALAVRGRNTDASGRGVVAELAFGRSVWGQHFSLDDGRYADELFAVLPPAGQLWVEVRPLYSGVGDTVTQPFPPARWRFNCPGAPGALDTAVLDVRLPPPRRAPG